MDKIIFRGAVAMAAVLVAANYLVQFRLGDWLTWAAFAYPLTFLVSDCVNRAAGAAAAWRVAVAGFVCGVPLSFVFSYFVMDSSWVTSARIAAASGTAFALAQAVDITVFSRLRRAAWWVPSLASSAPAAVLDTLFFFSLAFAGTSVPWEKLALGDVMIKGAMAFLMLPAYRLLTRRMA